MVDETIFHANDEEKFIWVLADNPNFPLTKKSEGAGIMCLDFVLSTGEYVELTDSEFAQLRANVPGVFSDDDRAAVFYLEYGKARDGYMDSGIFLDKLRRALRFAHAKYPHCQFAFIVDRSSVHERYADNALRVTGMNVKPGGKQPKLRQTAFEKDGELIIQDMVFPSDHLEFPNEPKGLLAVCEERGLLSAGESRLKEDLQALLKLQPDFQHERSLLHELIEDEFGDVLLLLPKFHPELNGIEYVWARQKEYARRNCSRGIVKLRQTIRDARKSVPLETRQNCFLHARQYAMPILTVTPL